MGIHQFSVVVTGLDAEADNFEERLFRAGCDDATIVVHKAAVIIMFSRESGNLCRALLTAVRAVQSTGAKVEHLEPDYLVSLSEIASRARISRAAVALFARGEFGQDFPAPVARIGSDNPLWDWVAVARWMYRRHDLPLKEVVAARVMRQASLALAVPGGTARLLARRLPRGRRIDRRV